MSAWRQLSGCCLPLKELSEYSVQQLGELFRVNVIPLTKKKRSLKQDPQLAQVSARGISISPAHFADD